LPNPKPTTTKPKDSRYERGTTGGQVNLYDLWTLPKSVDIDMDDVAAAIRGTFARRDTIVPAACPVGLSEDFSTDPAKVTQWRAYSDGTALEERPLAEVTAEVWVWLEPACRAAA
jgi:hypothetical protein